MPANHRLSPFLGLFLLVLSLAGCQRVPPEQAILDNYRVRLARSLDVTSPDIEIALPPGYPSRRELTQPLAEVQVDLLEFLRLSRCDLQRLIGERNASLGKVMSHSQRWRYEARFIVAGRECQAQLLRDHSQVALQAVLQQAIDSKIHERQAVTWNATFASEEFQTLFSLSTTPIAIDQPRPSELIDALARLKWLVNRWHQADIPPEATLESHYQVVGADRWLGQLTHSLVLINAELRALNSIQRERLAGRPLCFQQRANTQAQTLNTVFLKYYIGQVQPYLAQVYQQGDAVLAEMAALYELSRAGDDPALNTFAQFWAETFASDDERSQWHQFEQLIDEHTKNWQQQLRQCGLMPGS